MKMPVQFEVIKMAKQNVYNMRIKAHKTRIKCVFDLFWNLLFKDVFERTFEEFYPAHNLQKYGVYPWIYGLL
jgi:hypothetical protein